MKKSLRLTVASVAVALMVGGLGVTAASATTVYPPEGGTWNYGVRAGGVYGTRGEVYSEYKVGRVHRSKACGAWCDGGAIWYSPNIWSPARAMAAPSGNTAFYNVL